MGGESLFQDGGLLDPGLLPTAEFLLTQSLNQWLEPIRLHGERLKEGSWPTAEAVQSFPGAPQDPSVQDLRSNEPVDLEATGTPTEPWGAAEMVPC